MISNLHISHSSDRMMILTAKHRIFLPEIKQDLKKYYEKYPKCLEFKHSKAKASTENSYKNLFMNFEPGIQVQADFCKYGREDFMLICCEISGFLKVSET